MPTPPREEIVTIVDDKNRVVGAAPRSRMRAEGLPHRAVYILVFNTGGDLFVQKRTTGKDIYPGYHDVATGGIVLAGESYAEAAARELAEELGVNGARLKALFDFFYQDGGNRVWGRAFSCVHDGDVVLQAEEVESGTFYSVGVIDEMSRRLPFTPDGLYMLKRYLAHASSPPHGAIFGTAGANDNEK